MLSCTTHAARSETTEPEVRKQYENSIESDEALRDDSREILEVQSLQRFLECLWVLVVQVDLVFHVFQVDLSDLSDRRHTRDRHHPCHP